MRFAMLSARALLALVIVLATIPGVSRAQVLVPQPGFGSFSLNYQWAHASNHLFSTDTGVGTGNRLDMGAMDSQTTFVTGDYCFVRGLAATATAAFVAARYLGTLPEHPTDTREFQSSPQDASIGLRYVAGFEGITIGTSAAYTFPMSDYLTMGHNALGRGINQANVGLSLSRALPRLPGVVAGIAVSHDFQEAVSVWDLGTNHFNAGLGYFVTSALSLGAHFSYSQTNNGFDWADPNDWAVPGGGKLHDQAAAALVRTAGGSVNYQFGSSYSLGIDIGGVLSGANTTDPMSYTLLTSYNFWSPWARHKSGF